MNRDQTSIAANGSLSKGFTLVELMIVIAILGIVITSIFTLYLNMQRNTIDQEDVVDVQQNIRVTMDFLSHDISMAGAVIFRDTSPVNTASATSLILNTASELQDYALVSNDKEIPNATTSITEQVLTVEIPDIVDRFASGNSLRIYRPLTGEQPYSAAALTVKSVNRTARTIGVIGFNSPAEPIQYRAGDIIARISSGAPDPATIQWGLNGTDVVRNTNGGTNQVVASDISSLQFSYLLDDGSETATPAASDLSSIRAVRATLTATRQKKFNTGQTRQRSVSSVIHLRNH